MIIVSSDNKRLVEIGTSDVWTSLYSTVHVRLQRKSDLILAIQFFETGRCESVNGYETARQINLIRDRLSQISPEKVVYDYKNQKIKTPWNNNLSPVITSCANYFTTADGKDLLYELVSILCYAQIMDVSIFVTD